jgi:glutathione S-transferase
MASPAAKALAEEHKKATGSDKLARGGYPDMGMGRYSDSLSYSDWLLLANAQRAHYNYVEGFGSVVTLALVSGLKYPVPTAIGCGVYALGREIFNQVYTDIKQGADSRMRGAAILDIALVGLLGGAIASAGSIAKLW